MGCILTGGGCCGEALVSGASEALEPSPGCVPWLGGLNIPSTRVGWRSSLSRRDGCFGNPFKGGID